MTHSLTWKGKVFESLKFVFKRSARYRRNQPATILPTVCNTSAPLCQVRVHNPSEVGSGQTNRYGAQFSLLLCSDLKSENPDPDQCFYNVRIQ
jgi:hypothetical protein